MVIFLAKFPALLLPAIWWTIKGKTAVTITGFLPLSGDPSGVISNVSLCNNASNSWWFSSVDIIVLNYVSSAHYFSAENCWQVSHFNLMADSSCEIEPPEDHSPYITYVLEMRRNIEIMGHHKFESNRCTDSALVYVRDESCDTEEDYPYVNIVLENAEHEQSHDMSSLSELATILPTRTMPTSCTCACSTTDLIGPSSHSNVTYLGGPSVSSTTMTVTVTSMVTATIQLSTPNLRTLDSETENTAPLIAVTVLLALLVLVCGVLLLISFVWIRFRTRKTNDKLKKGIVLKNSEIASDHVHSEPIHNNYTGEGHYELQVQLPQDYETPERHHHANAIQEHIYWEPPESAEDLYAQINKRKEFTKIDIGDIELSHQLGEGQFGEVYKGRIKNGKRVAVKKLREVASEDEKTKLLKEAAIMGQFSHPYIIRLIGVAMEGNKILIVMELAKNGDLRSYLLRVSDQFKEKDNKEIRNLLLKFCIQISDAMSYLSKKKFIHRDLAARNILLEEDLNCKLADFGMSHDMDKDYYYKPKGGQIPVKWTAPEAILYGKYTTKSDVWSFGMVMFEIWSLGHKPFEDFEIEKLIKTLPSGYCQPPPPGCSKKIYMVMVHCWDPDYHRRKTMAEIYSLLARIDEQSVEMSEADKGIFPEAATLGAPLPQGSRLYPDLQNVYLNA